MKMKKLFSVTVNSCYIFILFLLLPNYSQAQSGTTNKYGLKVIDNINDYKKSVEKDSLKRMVDLEKFIPGIKIDIRYATKNNFTKKVLYHEAKAFLRLPAAIALKKIQNELKKQNLELKIYDAYRPYAVTVLMWDYLKDDSHVATPQKGSRHNRGCAVDLTIIDSKTGNEIEMPTPYDNFTIKARPTYMNLPKNVLKNRALLKGLMEKYGFKSITSEWWHYDFKGYTAYEILDIPFKKLESVINE
jgi:D-alanyl-D-alanine dipeptidase